MELGSTTFNREDLERGFEPDASFYIRNEALIRGKRRIDLNVDPPPDLVIEVDITSPSLDKFPIYARPGVPEVWRYDGERLTIYELRSEEFVEVAVSKILPCLAHKRSLLTRFIEESTLVDHRDLDAQGTRVGAGATWTA